MVTFPTNSQLWYRWFDTWKNAKQTDSWQHTWDDRWSAPRNHNIYPPTPPDCVYVCNLVKVTCHKQATHQTIAICLPLLPRIVIVTPRKRIHWRAVEWSLDTSWARSILGRPEGRHNNYDQSLLQRLIHISVGANVDVLAKRTFPLPTLLPWKDTVMGLLGKGVVLCSVEVLAQN